MNIDYMPHPIIDDSIPIPKDLECLQEDLSRNVHEVWAAGRIKAGWKYGPVRDDLKKEHPCLIPYEELTEEEKDYDRATALSTIRFILSKGYRLTK